MAATYLGEVRMGEPREVRPADSEETLALLHTLGGACRGRLRLLTTRRDRPHARPRSRPGCSSTTAGTSCDPAATRPACCAAAMPRDLGLFTLPLVDAVTDEGGA